MQTKTKTYPNPNPRYTPGISSASPLATKTDCERVGCLQYCDQPSFDPLLAATIGAAVGLGLGAGIMWAMKGKRK